MHNLMNIIRRYSASIKLHKNAMGGRNLVAGVAVLTKAKTIVAWHPEPNYQYEFSKPLPTAVEAQTTSLIKEEALRTAMSAFKEKRPEVALEELMQLTHTTKHRWFERARDRKAKKTPMDRSYL